MPDTAAIEIRPPETLREFYGLMARTREVRARMVEQYLAGADIAPDDIRSLRNAGASLEATPRSKTDDGYEIVLDGERRITVDLTYEISEIVKDLVLLERGEDALYEHLATLYPGFTSQVDKGVAALAPHAFRALVTDRDGTVNNYCGRYLTSIQSVYNAVFLTRFARACVPHAVMLTSAPLRDGGLVDIATMPRGAFVYAGSKGREYLDQGGTYGSYPIDPAQQQMITRLNTALGELLARPGHEKFGLIGSGLQKKFGQTTIARQDITHSVPEDESRTFLHEVEDLVAALDPREQHFRIEDTGLDIEIILTVGDRGGGLKDFDKGDAVVFLDEALDLGLAEGPALVCGDTSSDVPMVAACAAKNAGSHAVFATVKQDVRDRVSRTTSRSLFVDTPDVLVVILHELSKQGGNG
ncbi:MAG: trehalose 6-phosphate synthase [Chitinivibrionales bacterium]|nr:trehalose 6-phosphate synthase [Chitinivibrionales bacterium]MBD3396798.1 trehalose 6-phosphate synthase [Chitinivibrionales bacterium]